MPCSEEAIAKLFYNVSGIFVLSLLLSYFTSILLAKFFYFIGGNPFLWRNQDEYEFSDEEMEDETEYYHNNFNAELEEKNLFEVDTISRRKTVFNESCEDELQATGDEIFCSSNRSTEEESIYSAVDSESDGKDEKIPIDSRGADDSDSDSDTCSCYYEVGPTNTNGLGTNTINHGNINREIMSNEEEKVMKEENSIGLTSKLQVESKNRLQFQDNKDDSEHEIFGDTCTVGSTSKSSTEWRSSIKDSSADQDPNFSSSSRRSCHKWESYTIFQKYDEDMLFLDRITAQKLQQTETLRRIQACPRSISDRIVHKLGKKYSSSGYGHHNNNPYDELEAAYVAQLCLAWEALSWNYKYFQRLRAASRNNKETDPGCPAHVAQQFQQFQVLLQRYVENEPYEHGKRPEIYARIRSSAPKLLQVPEYRDSEEEKGHEEIWSRISSESFHIIMKESIRTFMNFVKADKENRWAALFKRKNTRGSADVALLLLLKKVNKKKISKVKEVGGSGNCMGKRNLREDEEMEVLMALIDLKVVGRVLRMRLVNDEQLQWCEGKMSKVRVDVNRKLQRDSSPLFFPAH